jgi:broad specificity phosphatase PhoE
MKWLALVLAWAIPAAAQDEPWALLRQGGHVVLLRHGVTTPGVGDPPDMRLADCSTQRNLSEEGRDQARRIAEGFSRFQVPVEKVLSSEWCRCIETAALAFGDGVELGGWRGKGNLVLVTHGSTIFAVTRVGTQMGEMLILAPRGADRFALVSRLKL